MATRVRKFLIVMAYGVVLMIFVTTFIFFRYRPEAWSANLSNFDLLRVIVFHTKAMQGTYLMVLVMLFAVILGWGIDKFRGRG